MADIFISYASDDRPRVEPLAKALADAGWIVWWDLQIPVGRRYDEVIAKALDQAKSIVVIWSEESVTSDWVLEEASVGSENGILVPAMIDPVQIPMGFRRVQSANLVDWVPGKPHQGFDRLVAAIKALLDEGMARPPCTSMMRKRGVSDLAEYLVDPIALTPPALEATLASGSSTGKFCHGDHPTLADCCLVPQVYNARRYEVDLTPFPIITKIEAACMALEGFDQARPENQPDAVVG
jgi:hypothetical protein